MNKPFLTALLTGLTILSFHAYGQTENCAMVVDIAGGSEAQRLEVSLLVNSSIDKNELGQIQQVSSSTHAIYINSATRSDAYLNQLALAENVSLQQTDGYALVIAKVPKLEIHYTFFNAVDRYFAHGIVRDIVTSLTGEGKLDNDFLLAPNVTVKNLGHCD